MGKGVKPAGRKQPARPFAYRPQYGVIVLCEDEAQHRQVYERLRGDGYRCRVVCA